MNVPAAISVSVKILCVVIGIGASAVHEAHADTVAAAAGISIQPDKLRCFSIASGAVMNNGSCGAALQSWEIQAGVRGTGWHAVTLYTSFGDINACEVFITNQHAQKVRVGFKYDPVIESISFRRHFDKLWINRGDTLNVQCWVPVNGFVRTVSSFGL